MLGQPYSFFFRKTFLGYHCPKDTSIREAKFERHLMVSHGQKHVRNHVYNSTLN